MLVDSFQSLATQTKLQKEIIRKRKHIRILDSSDLSGASSVLNGDVMIPVAVRRFINAEFETESGSESSILSNSSAEFSEFTVRLCRRNW